MNYVMLSHCGSALGEGAFCIRMRNQAAPVLRHVTVRNINGIGVLVSDDGSAFGPGSTTLSVSGGESYPVRIGANQADTVPTGGTFTDNTFNVIDLRGNVSRSQTWPKLSIPYGINDFVNVGSASTPTLTLLAGTEVRFGRGYALTVGPDRDNRGVLDADGTEDAPIRFVPDATTPPTRGYWRGLHFWYALGSRLDNVIVTHAGAEGSVGTGNVNVYREIGLFVANSTLSDSSGCGITVSDGSRSGSTEVTTDFTPYNTFVNNEGGAQCKN